MFKYKLTIDSLLLIAANIVPLIGVWFYGWNAQHMFLVYCMETVIIGVINVVKMASVTLLVRKKEVWQNNGATSMQSGWLFIAFFIVHYGIFVFVQTQLFFAISNISSGISFPVSYAKVPQMLGADGQLTLLIFIASYTLQTVFSFFTSGNYKTISLSRLMFEPYMRIFIQQFVVIVGSIFLAFGAGQVFILIFILAKIFFESFINYNRILEIIDKRAKLKTKQVEKL